MRVELTIGALMDQHAEDILLLLRHFADGRHLWALSPLDMDTVEAYVHRHFPQLAEVYVQLAQKSAVKHAAWTAADTPPRARITYDNVPHQIADLNRPAVVAVENNRSDGSFIVAIARAWAADDILQAIDKDWLVIEHGGGKPDACRRAKEEHRKFCHLNRVAALLDSDRMAPGVETDSHRRAERLRQAGILAHVLELREAENYIPNRVLHIVKPIGESSRRLYCLKTLTPAQRGYFDMKKGFGDAGSIPDVQAALFEGVPRRVIRGLARGFGVDVLQYLEQQSKNLTPADFASVGPGVRDELESILAMLREIV